MASGSPGLSSGSSFVNLLGVVDYGVGNMRSVANALNRIGADWEIAQRPSDLPRFQRLLLPGVGAFGAAMFSLAESGLKDSLVDAAENGVPVLGICLGMQLLSEHSEESPGVPGLGLIAAQTRAVTPGVATNTGFRRVRFPAGEGEAATIIGEKDYYFNHSFHVLPAAADLVSASFLWNHKEVVAAVSSDNIFGVQFHPEKSQGQGLALLRRFAAYGVLQL